MNSLIQLRKAIFVFLVVLTWSGLSPTSRAVSPSPDGGYPKHNTAEGEDALFSLTAIGHSNTAIGFHALYSGSVGGVHDQVGTQENTAVGSEALSSMKFGINNTAIGCRALASANNGSNPIDGNTAIGSEALSSLTNGGNNTATGAAALHDNTTGYRNTAIGTAALRNSTTGSYNTATGHTALAGDYEWGTSSGSNNTADGADALRSFTTGNKNTAVGNDALRSNTTGSDNTAVGLKALYTSNGKNNIALGLEAGVNLTTGSNNIDIGNKGVAGESDTIRIGTVKKLLYGREKKDFAVVTRTFIAGIHKQNEGGVDIKAVYVNSNGQLGTQTLSSSRRFKKEIKPMNSASEAILALKPVTFHYKSDKTGTPQFGLIAEEVAEINPDLVVRDENGEIYTVRYDAVNAMLLNEFLKEHRKVEAQQATITQLKSAVAQQKKDFQATVARQQKQIEALTAGLQKVSAQIEMSRPAPQVVENSR